MTTENARPARRTVSGVVVSDKMDKTVVVAVESTHRHPLYGRTMRRTRRFKAHDERNEAKTGDRVIIAESRPLSKEKRWRVVEIVRRGEVFEPVGGEDVQA
jgi:small subunit ribosomal protein S17